MCAQRSCIFVICLFCLAPELLIFCFERERICHRSWVACSHVGLSSMFRISAMLCLFLRTVLGSRLSRFGLYICWGAVHHVVCIGMCQQHSEECIGQQAHALWQNSGAHHAAGGAIAIAMSVLSSCLSLSLSLSLSFSFSPAPCSQNQGPVSV
jgi:hypothetical protein